MARRSILGFLSTDLEYSTVLVGDAEHLERVAAKFFNRAKLFRQLSFFLLLASLLFVAVGIVVFLLPSKFADLDDKDDLFRRLDQLVADRTKLLSESAEIGSDQERARLVLHSLLDFDDLNSIITSSSEEAISQWRPGSQVDLLVARAYEISFQFSSNDPETVTVDHSNPIRNFKYASAKERLPKDVLIYARETYSLSKAENLELSNQLDKIRDLIAAEEVNKASLVQETRKLLGRLFRYSEAFSLAVTEYEKARAAQSEFSLEGKKLQEELKSVEQQIGVIERAIQERAGNTGFWEGWISMFTIRVCVVVLLLFLTQILLSTYRYLISIGAYYAARGDALQLVSSKARSNAIDSDEYAKLVTMMSPDEHKVEKTEGPDERILSALTAALEKIPSVS